MPMTTRQRRLWAALAVATLGFAIAWWLRPREKPPAAPAAAAATTAEFRPMAPWQPIDAPPKSAPLAPVPGFEGTPFIKDVTVDADDVCPNEPMTVNVIAFDDRPQPRPLHVTINGRAGSTVVLWFGAATEYTVVIRADDDRGASDQRQIKLKVHDCGDGKPLATISVDTLPRPDAVAFIVHPFIPRPECKADGGPMDMKCAHRLPRDEKMHVVWDFGDGTTEEGDGRSIEHDYSRRSQDGPSSSFLVRARVTTKEHGELQGVTAVSFPNTAYTNKQNLHVITPLVTLGPVKKNGAAYEFALGTFNHEPVPLKLSKIDVEMIDCKSENDKPPPRFTVAASEVLDSVVIPPGEGKLTGTLRGNLASDRYCRAVASAKGTAPDGFPVLATFGVQMQQPQGETIKDDPKDPAVHARIARVQQAMKILGRDPAHGGTVTEDEIQALERKGLLH